MSGTAPPRRLQAPFLLLAALVVLVAAAMAIYVIRGLVDGGGVIGYVLDRGGVPAGAGFGWVAVAPLLLLAGAWWARERLLLWVVVVVAQLLVLVGFLVWLGEDLPDGTVGAIACYGLLGAASVLVGVAARD